MQKTHNSGKQQTPSGAQQLVGMVSAHLCLQGEAGVSDGGSASGPGGNFSSWGSADSEDLWALLSTTKVRLRQTEEWGPDLLC